MKTNVVIPPNVLRRTKIVCSVGPACSKPEIIEQLIIEGVNVFRLNFSFGSYNEMSDFVQMIRAASQKLGKFVSIMGDLQGPKFRTNDFIPPTTGVELIPGKMITLAYSKDKVSSTPERITCPHDNLMKALRKDDRILIYDGAMEIKVVEKIGEMEALCVVVRGGELKARKGLNVPTVVIHFDDILPKDKEDALFMLEQQVDFMSLSFVQTASEVIRLREFLKKNAKEGQKIPAICSKIEKPAALENLDEIVKVSDAVMVARGDLGVELSLEMVPIAQKIIIQKANEARIPVITATQMLNSMITEAVPTRAEVSDVANAIFDGTDAVMTSGETSVSPHPVLVIQTMARILRTQEYFLPPHSLPNIVDLKDPSQISVAVALSALEAAQKSSAKAILVFSTTGDMARMISKGRPNCPVFVFTPDVEVCNYIRLLYAVYPILMPFGQYSDTTIALAEQKILERKLLDHGELVVLCAGRNPGLPALSSVTKIYQLGEFLKHFASAFLPDRKSVV